MDDALLTFYKVEWDRFTTGMKYGDHIFNYLVCNFQKGS